MKLEEFVDTIGVSIQVVYSKNQYMPWMARINKLSYNLFYKENSLDVTQRYLQGGGNTPDIAIRALARKIKQSRYKLLIVCPDNDSSREDRKTFSIPDNLE